MTIHQEKTHLALQKALSDSFEGLAFAQVFSYRVCEQYLGEIDNITAAYIDMPAPLDFRFTLVLANAQVADFFDAASGGAALTPGLFADFNREVCNTAAGHIQTLLAPEKLDMLIGLPHVVEDPASVMAASATRCLLEYEVEEYNVYVVLEKPIPA